MDYILNTKTGILHEALCAKGKTPNARVRAGDQQYYSSSIENIQKNSNYKDCHINEYCISDEECYGE